MHPYERSDHIRQAIRLFHYGLYVLTCGLGEEARAATVTWVTQASMDPRRVVVGVRRDSHLYSPLRERGRVRSEHRRRRR